MSFDGFFLHHMTAELREQVLYGRIQKVNQPFERELVLTIRNNRQNYKLLLSAHPVFGRIQTTKADLPNPQNPNTYTMIMRKYLQGAVIEDIQQLENDRVLEISVSNKNEIGDSVKVTLVMEIMGKHSNIILIDKNEKLFEILQTEDLSARNLQKLFQGLGRDTANELSALLETDKLKNFRDFFNREVEPNLTAKAFSAVRFSDSQDQPEFETLSALLDYYYLDKAARDRVAQQASDLIHRVQNELEKNKKKLVKQEKELAATENAEEFRQKGELLTTYLSMVPNDKDSVELDNYYTGEKITIPLNVALTPNQNAQRYFKKYQKLN